MIDEALRLTSSRSPLQGRVGKHRPPRNALRFDSRSWMVSGRAAGIQTAPFIPSLLRGPGSTPLAGRCSDVPSVACNAFSTACKQGGAPSSRSANTGISNSPARRLSSDQPALLRSMLVRLSNTTTWSSQATRHRAMNSVHAQSTRPTDFTSCRGPKARSHHLMEFRSSLSR
jgi:hypothetical protein